MEHLYKHFWIAMILLTIVNALHWRFKGNSEISKRPQLRKGYNRLILGMIIWGNIPWLVMGAGVLAGGIADLRDLLRPDISNIWALAFSVSIIGILGLFQWWIFFCNGALKLVDHPGWSQHTITKSFYVKIFAVVSFLSAIIATVSIYSKGSVSFYPESESGDYTTVFTAYYGFLHVLGFGALFLGVGIGALIWSIIQICTVKACGITDKKKKSTPVALLGFSIIWLLMAGIGFGFQIISSGWLLLKYATGQADCVEGKVHVLRTQPEGGHAPGDMIEINGVKLTVNYYRTTAAYKQTISHGGALKEDINARVWYTGEKILRVDIKKILSSD